MSFKLEDLPYQRRSALACLAWHENIQDSTIKKLRDLAEADQRPFFICLERGLTTTAKWNLKHFLGNHFNAFYEEPFHFQSFTNLYTCTQS